MQKITPFLWFDDKAEEAANFYVSLFKNSRIGDIARYDEAGAKAAGRPKGSVMVIEFQLEGQNFVGLNGGPHFKFTEAISFLPPTSPQLARQPALPRARPIASSCSGRSTPWDPRSTGSSRRDCCRRRRFANILTRPADNERRLVERHGSPRQRALGRSHNFGGAHRLDRP